MFLESVLKSRLRKQVNGNFFAAFKMALCGHQETGNRDHMEVETPCIVIAGFSQPEPFIET